MLTSVDQGDSNVLQNVLSLNVSRNDSLLEVCINDIGQSLSSYIFFFFLVKRGIS